MNQLKTFFYSLKRSLFEPKYYKDVAQTRFWFSFKYLWFLLFLLALIHGISFGLTYTTKRPYIKPLVNNYLNSAYDFYPKNLKLKIANGQLSTNVKEPYIIDIGKEEWLNQKHFITIDTNGSIDNYFNYNTNILATKNAVVYPSKSSGSRLGETSIYYFNDLKQEVNIDKKAYVNLLNLAKPFLAKATLYLDLLGITGLIFFLFFGSLLWTGMAMFGLVFLTFFVWIINLIFKKRHGYGSLYKMGMHAVTWPILTSEFLGYVKSPFPKLYSLIFLIWMLIVLFSQAKKISRKAPAKKRG